MLWNVTCANIGSTRNVWDSLIFEKYVKVREVEDIMKWFCDSCNCGFKNLKQKVSMLENRVHQLETGMERSINDKITDIVT